MANTSLEKYIEQSTASVAPLKQESIALLEEAKTIVVTDNDSLTAAIAMKKRITSQNTSVETARKQLTAPLDNVKSQLMDLERDVKVELDEAKNYIAKQILDYEAEQLRIKEEKRARIAEMVQSLTVEFSEAATVEDLQELGKSLKQVYGDLSENDQVNPEIKQQLLSSIGKITNRIDDIKEEEARRAEDERLAAIAAQQSEEATRLAKQKSEQEAEDRRIARERKDLADRQAQQALEDERRAQEAAEEKAAKAAPKTNTVTNYNFTITEPSKVPAAYLSPDEKKIHEAIKQTKGTILIPGVEITTERKTR